MLIGIDTLITAGCSFTKGVGLGPKESPWPNLLAKKLDFKLVNLAQPGAGNQYISNQILSHGPQPNALYIVCWSSWARYDFATNQGKIIHINPSWTGRNELAKIIYANYYNPTYLYKKFLLNVVLLQSWFKAHNLNYIMFDAMTNVQPQEDYYDSLDMIRLENQIDQSHYIGFQRLSIDNIVHHNKLNDGHPNAAGHELVCEFLYQHITQ